VHGPELLRRRQDQVEPLGDDVRDRLGSERRIEDVGRDLGIEVDSRRRGLEVVREAAT
jgi:hypothetical protein